MRPHLRRLHCPLHPDHPFIPTQDSGSKIPFDSSTAPIPPPNDDDARNCGVVSTTLSTSYQLRTPPTVYPLFQEPSASKILFPSPNAQVHLPDNDNTILP